MANKKLERAILNIFEPNIMENITTDDMRIFISAIFQASENIIHKFDESTDVDDFRLSNPDISINKSDIVILTNKTEHEGIYLSGVDKPFFKDLILIADLSTRINEVLNVSVKYPIEGDSLVYSSKYNQWINKSTVEKVLSTERPRFTHNGMMYFDSTLGRPIWFNSRINNWVDALGKII